MTTKPTTELVGYKHPPRAHQFKPGTSGNPSGRPKGARSLKTDLREELGELISFGDGKNLVELSKQRALIKMLVGAALDGDARAMATVLSLTLRALGPEDGNQDEEPPEDHEIMDIFTPRRPRRALKTKTGANPNESEE